MSEITRLPWDVWRMIFSFLELSQLTDGVFCVKHFQPAWQHRHFWLMLTRKYFPQSLVDVESCSSWLAIRDAFQKLVLSLPLNPKQVKMNHITVENIRVVNEMLCRGKIRYQLHPLRIIVPPCRLNCVNWPDNTPYSIYLSRNMTNPHFSNDMFEFLKLYDQRLIELASESSNMWLGHSATIEECSKLYRSWSESTRMTILIPTELARDFIDIDMSVEIECEIEATDIYLSAIPAISTSWTLTKYTQCK
uniref:F-box domain-containing protein n=1 Tax=viral metagenome TaxID=1070528 RepID=A0A6C0BPE6_9ZZZZ